MAAPALLRAAPIGQLPPDFDLRLDWRLVAFTAAVTVLASLGSAGICLARAHLMSASTLLASNARTIVRGRRLLVDRLIAIQVGCAVVLMATAGAMTRTMSNLLNVDPGFDAVGTLSVGVDTSAQRLEPARLHDYFSRLTDRVSTVEGVAGAAVVQVGLMSGAATTGTVDVPGFVPYTDEDRWVRMFFVGPGFFEVTGMHLLAGEAGQQRHLTSNDRIAVVNEQFARFYFGGLERAVGRTANKGIRIVGVVADAHYDSPRELPPRAMFVPFTQVGSRPRMTLIVRPRPGAQVAAAVTAAIRDFDPTARVTVATGHERLAATLARERFVAFLVAALSLFGVCLASAGLYGAVSYAISERRKELAVRVALGATRRDVLSLILQRPLRTTLAGVAFGVPAAWMTMRLLDALLFGIPRFDPAGLAASAAMVVALTLAATIQPVRRALGIDAQECLKCE
jgi:predicted permease